MLGNTSVSPDGKDLLSSEPEPPTATLSLSVPAAIPALTMTAGAVPPGTLPSAAAAPGSNLPPLIIEGSSTVLALHNMMTASDLENEEEMTEILEDTKIECGKFGPVASIVAPKPGTGGLPGSGIAVSPTLPPLHSSLTHPLTPNANPLPPPPQARDIEMRVFVRFGSHDAAAAAAKELHGKQARGSNRPAPPPPPSTHPYHRPPTTPPTHIQFDGRTVTAAFLAEALFDALNGLSCFVG
mgnify:CR=1 FL=1